SATRNERDGARTLKADPWMQIPVGGLECRSSPSVNDVAFHPVPTFVVFHMPQFWAAMMTLRVWSDGNSAAVVCARVISRPTSARFLEVIFSVRNFAFTAAFPVRHSPVPLTGGQTFHDHEKESE